MFLIPMHQFKKLKKVAMTKIKNSKLIQAMVIIACLCLDLKIKEDI